MQHIFVLFVQFEAEFKRCCPEARDFIVYWEDMAPHVTEWASKKTNTVLESLLAEMCASGKPTLGK